MNKFFITLGTAGTLALTGTAFAQSNPVKPSPLAAPKPAVGQNTIQQGKRMATGKIVDMRDIDMKSSSGNASGKFRMLEIESKSGKRMLVNTGLADQPVEKLALKKGDHIVAIGKSARINGKPALFAQYVGELKPVGRMTRNQ